MAEAVKTQSLFSYYGASHDGKQLPVTPEEVSAAVGCDFEIGPCCLP